MQVMAFESEQATMSHDSPSRLASMSRISPKSTTSSVNSGCHGPHNLNVLGFRNVLQAFRYIGDQQGIKESDLHEKLKKVSDKQLRQQTMEHLHELFEIHDKDKSRTLDLMEFQDMLNSSTLLQKAVYTLLVEAGQEVSEDSPHENLMEMLVLFLVGLNCVVMAISADYSQEWIGWQVIEIVFLAAFTVEIIIKVGSAAMRHIGSQNNGVCSWSLCVLQGAQDYLREPMNVFDVAVTVMAGIDLLLTFLQVGESTNLTMFRIFRLARLGRLAKVFRGNRELGLLISGIATGMRTVLWSFVLLGTITFTLAVLLRQNREQGNHEELDKTFSSVPSSMFVIFRCLVLGSEGACSDGNNEPFFTTLSDEMGWLFKIPWLISEVLVICGILNVIASVFLVQAQHNNHNLQQKIDTHMKPREDKLLMKLDKLLRTLVRPQRKSMPPMERQATNVTRYIQQKHPEVLSKVPNLSKAVVGFARNIQDSKEKYQFAMDRFELEEMEACNRLRNVPCAQLHYVNEDEVLLADDTVDGVDAEIELQFGIGLASPEACEVLLLQESNHLAELMEEAHEVQQYVKSLILPNSTWALTPQAGFASENNCPDSLNTFSNTGRSAFRTQASSSVWHQSDKLCDEAYDPGVKGQNRIREKVEMKYEGKYERNRDYSRIGLIYESVKHMLHSLQTFLHYRLDSNCIEVVKLDNRFREPTSLGWMDITLLMRVRVPSSGRLHLMEVQMQLHDMMEVKGTQHGFYSAVRAILPDDALRIIIDQLTTDTTLDLGMTALEWQECLKNEGVKEILDELRVPECIRKDIVDILDADGSGTVTSLELREALLRCRGEPHAADLIDCKLKIQHLQHHMQSHLETQMHLLHDMLIGNGKDMLQIQQDMLRGIHDKLQCQEKRISQPCQDVQQLQAASRNEVPTEPVNPPHINKSVPTPQDLKPSPQDRNHNARSSPALNQHIQHSPQPAHPEPADPKHIQINQPSPHDPKAIRNAPVTDPFAVLRSRLAAPVAKEWAGTMIEELR